MLCATSKTQINDAARMAMAVGLAGYQYGSPAVHVQPFVESAFQTFLSGGVGDSEDRSSHGDVDSGSALVACCRLTHRGVSSLWSEQMDEVETISTVP